MQPDRVSVPNIVMDGILAVRASGKTNMLDLPEVVRIAVEMDFIDAAVWIESNRSSYSRGVISGFRVVEGETG
ncbi:MAG: DUF5049 domain-containing protein [Armatimonadota bacterium]